MTDVYPVARQSFGKPDYQTNFPWDGFVQCGERGIVFSRKGNYSTAFFEYFGDVAGFVRGEGATLEESEKDAWEKTQVIVNCVGHDFVARGYTNGAGFCKHCNKFESGVFAPKELDQYCWVCGKETYLKEKGEGVSRFACEQHAYQHRMWLLRTIVSIQGVNGDEEKGMFEELSECALSLEATRIGVGEVEDWDFRVSGYEKFFSKHLKNYDDGE